MDNFTRLSTAMGLLGDALAPFVERELKRMGSGWWTTYVLPNVSPSGRQRLPAMPTKGAQRQLGALDIADVLMLLSRNFSAVFRDRLPEMARSYADELRATRNVWAHKPAKGDIDASVAERAIDTAALLIEPIDRSAAAAIRALRGGGTPGPSGGAPVQLEAAAVAATSMEARVTVPASAPDAGLRPWREVAVPRADVRTGTLTYSQFAADLHEVYRQNPDVATEYLDAREFFDRTYVTSGLREFLRTALRRLTGKGGDPVVQLKTGFGGGKTHTMLALYHLARSGADIVNDVPVLKELSEELNTKIPRAKVAVLVGTKISATAPFDDDPELKALGISLKTLWGHMAWQLGGWKAYELVQRADDTGVAPGEELRKVFEMASPCIVLMDELVAYGRNLPQKKGQVPGGTLESLLTFLQTLTELAASTPGVIVAASIPESEQEIGGPQGHAVLGRIQQMFGKLEAAWQPVQPTESFEVVRRRLFERIDTDGRDQAVAAFLRYYREHAQAFPAEVRERDYEERMLAAYPFHPELFDRLYLDWNAAVPTFQSTRGVLRLLAGAVQAMWQEQDASALIMPATIRFDLPTVREELMRHLPPAFQSVIDSDIEGPTAAAVQIDATHPLFGRVGAARAIARTILLGSVPGKATPGLEDVRIRLGAARPGEQIAIYNDALSRLRERLQYLHGSGSRYWFEVRPNLNRTVADRMSRIGEYEVYTELESRLKADRDTGDFAGKHVAPMSSGDVPDGAAVRLVVIPPRLPYIRGAAECPAIDWAREVLRNRGNAPRLHRNMLVFVALDEDVHRGLVDAAKSYLAWKSIVDERRQLSLDEEQVRHATEARDKAQSMIVTLLSEGYRWAIVPVQEVRQEGGKWKVGEERMKDVDIATGLGPAGGSLAQRVGAALQKEEGLLLRWSPMFVKRELERWFWSQGLDHVGTRQFWDENLTRYPFFPRLRDREVLAQAIRDGATSRDFFGYAVGYEGGKYVGLSFGQRPPTVLFDEASVIVRKEVAERCVETPRPGASGGSPEPGPASGPATPARKVHTRFYGSVELNPLKLSTSAGQIADEIVRHLTGLLDAEVDVVLEVRAKVPGGIPEHIERTVGENAAALKFRVFEFEEE